MPTYTSHYPPVQDAAHVKATSTHPGAAPWYATDPAKSLVGPSVGTAWSTPENPTPPIKFTLDHGEPFVAARIYLENQHYSGMYTYNRLDQFEIYGTNSATAFANVSAVADLSDLTLLGTFTARAHVSSNISDPQYFLIEGNKTPFRYTVIRALNLPSGASTIVFRRIEIQSDDEAGPTVLGISYGVDPEYTKIAPIAFGADPEYALAQIIFYGATPLYAGNTCVFGVSPIYTRAPIALCGANPWYGQASLALYGTNPLYASLIGTAIGVSPEYGSVALSFYGSDPLYLHADKEQALYGTNPEYTYTDSKSIAYGNDPLYQSQQTLNYGPVYTGTGTPGELVDVLAPTGEFVGRARVGTNGTYQLHTYLSPDWRPTEVYIAGQRVYPKQVSLRFMRQEIAHLATLDFTSPAVLLLAQRDANVVLKMWGRTVHLVVAESAATHLAHGEYSASVTCQSKGIRLELPAAQPVLGELSGLMSEVAASLAGDITISWQTVDDFIKPGQWIAAGESPLELLRELSTAVGGVLHSTYDGGLAVVPMYPNLVPQWPVTTPDVTISTLDEVEVVDTEGQWQPGYNRCEVGAQAVSASSLRIEEDSSRSTAWRKVVLVYQTPWRGDFSLDHADDPSFVVLEDLGVEERIVMGEDIQILRGQGNTQYPIYEFVSARYKARNLGTLTTSEDGTIKTTIEGASLLYLSYRTKAHVWAVRDIRDGKVMLIAEREENGV